MADLGIFAAISRGLKTTFKMIDGHNGKNMATKDFIEDHGVKKVAPLLTAVVMLSVATITVWDFFVTDKRNGHKNDFRRH